MKPTIEDLDLINKKAMLTVEEAALYMGVDRSTIYSLCHFSDGSEGPLPHYHVGKGIRIFRELLDYYIISNSKCLNQDLVVDFKHNFTNNTHGSKVETGHKGGMPHV